MSIWIYVVWFNNQPPKYKLWTRFWFELLWGRNISIIRPDRCSTDASRGLNLRMLGTTLNTSLPSKPILSLHSAQPLWLHWCSNLSLILRIFGNWNRTKILKCPDTQFCDKEGSTNDIFSARIQTIQVKEVGKWWFLTVGHGHYNGQNIIKATWHSIIFSIATRKDIKEYYSCLYCLYDCYSSVLRYRIPCCWWYQIRFNALQNSKKISDHVRYSIGSQELQLKESHETD